MPEFWLAVLVLGPALGWIAGYPEAVLPRRTALAIVLSAPFILFIADMLSVAPGDNAGAWLAIGLAMVAFFEIPWTILVTLGFASTVYGGGVVKFSERPLMRPRVQKRPGN
jgi:hypothetical protein